MNSLVSWVLMEIFLNCVGLDDIADYAEFLQSLHGLIELHGPKIVFAIDRPTKSCIMGIIN
ncbi:MAG: hypothetical protein R3321_05860 [Nitrososphaeraceae archaeon]|nr:hypothetical protein [Nitrososphaeraceae archaeon]